MQGCKNVAESRSSGWLAVCDDREQQTQTVNTSDVKATSMARLTCTRNPKTRNITGRKGGRTTICNNCVEQAQSIFYTKHNTLILPSNRRGRWLLRLLLLLTVVGENKKRYYYTVESTRYI